MGDIPECATYRQDLRNLQVEQGNSERSLVAIASVDRGTFQNKGL